MSKSNIKVFSPCNLNLILCFTGIISVAILLTFECKSCNFILYENSNLDQALKSSTMEKGGVALVFSTCPLLLDLLMDMFNDINCLFKSEQEIQCFNFRASLVLVSLVYGFHVMSNGSYFNIFDNYSLSFMFGMWSMRLIVICSSLSYLHTVNPKIFTLTQIRVYSVAFAVLALIRLFGATSTFLCMDIVHKVYPFIFLTMIFRQLYCWMSLLLINSKSHALTITSVCMYYVWLRSTCLYHLRCHFTFPL